MIKTNHPIFEYSNEIEKKLPAAIYAILGLNVTGVHKMEQGVMNYVFKIETEKGLLLARVFGRNDAVDIDKLLWIDQQLERNGIRRSGVLGYSKSDELFPYGYMITEYIHGKDGMTAISEGDIRLEDYFIKLGTLLKKIHTIPVSTYGEINSTDEGRNYSEYLVSKVKTLLTGCIDAKSLSKEQSENIVHKVNQTLSKFEDRFKPVLVHGDCGPSNQILSKEHELFMIDWDYARKGVWIEDLVPMILSADKFIIDTAKDTVTTTIRKSFLEGYGPTGFSEEEITELEGVFVLIALLHNLSFYSTDKRNQDYAVDVKKQIDQLIRL